VGEDFYGKETAHNCYGNASQGCGVYWNDNVSKPIVIAPNYPDLGVSNDKKVLIYSDSTWCAVP